MNEIELTKTLVEIESVSGNEARIGECIAALLQQDFQVTKQAVGARWNILATRGTPTLLFTSHLDTVPGNIPTTETETMLFGRGSCDAKASVAAMIIAGKEAVQEGYTNFGLLFDVSEETDFSGIKEAARLVNPEIVVLGEPTNNLFVIGQKGLLEIKISCTGIAAHAATPEKGCSAIEKLLHCLNAVHSLPLPKDPLLGSTTCVIGVIKGGSAINVGPNYAEALVSFRTTCNNAVVLEQIRALVLPCAIEIIASCDPVHCTSVPFKKMGIQNKVVPYFTELWFWKHTCAIVCGPGNPDLAHTKQECVEKEQITKAKELYKHMIQSCAHEHL